MNLKGIVFDLDDTLVDSPLDLDAVRDELGIVQGTLLIEHIDGLSTDEERARCWAVIHRHESEAALGCELMPGARELLTRLGDSGIPVGIWTRNSRETVDTVVQRFQLEPDLVVDRSFPHPKPKLPGLMHFCVEWSLRPGEIALIDDQAFALKAAKDAGMNAILLSSHKNREVRAPHADRVIATLSDIVALL